MFLKKQCQNSLSHSISSNVQHNSNYYQRSASKGKIINGLDFSVILRNLRVVFAQLLDIVRIENGWVLPFYLQSFGKSIQSKDCLCLILGRVNHFMWINANFLLNKISVVHCLMFSHGLFNHHGLESHNTELNIVYKFTVRAK